MGVTIEIYRSRIGSHKNFIEARNSLSGIKGRFLNEPLILFSLNSFYSPSCVRFNDGQKKNRICTWCLEISYHVHVPLLLRLSNDVEENPGPWTINDIVDPSYTVHADFNQGDDLLFGSNAGKQCVAMSLCAIIYKQIKSVNLWDKSSLNSILVYGNNLYGAISRSINKSYLLLTDVPDFVNIENQNFHVEYTDSYSGALFMEHNNNPFVTLQYALDQLFLILNYKSCLLTIGMNTVAIIMPFPGVFKVFDSHSRDLHGMPSVLGYCVLISVEGLENLSLYFQCTVSSNQPNIAIPFELKGVKVNTINFSNDSESDLSRKGSTNSPMVPDSLDESINYHITQTDNDFTLQKQQRPSKESLLAREKRLEKMKKYNNKKILKRQNESATEKEARLEKR